MRVIVLGGLGVNSNVNVAVIGAGYGLTVKVNESSWPASTVAWALADAVAGLAVTIKVCDPATAILFGSITVIVPVPVVANNDAGMTAVN